MRTRRLLDSAVSYLADDGVVVEATLGSVAADRIVRGMPVRRVRSHARRRNYCRWFWSATTGAHVPREYHTAPISANDSLRPHWELPTRVLDQGFRSPNSAVAKQCSPAQGSAR